jgi:hypothetical protein
VAKLIVISWRDIPAQVVGRAGRESVRRELPPRFARAIDRAALRAGRGESHAYLEDWRRESEEVSGDLAARVEERAARLEARFPPELLERLVRAGGRLDALPPPRAGEAPAAGEGEGSGEEETP